MFVPVEEQVELPADGVVPFPVLLLAQLAQVAYSADLAVVKFMPNSPNPTSWYTKVAEEADDGLDGELEPSAHPTTMVDALDKKWLMETSTEMHPLHKKVYVMCVVFTNVPFAMGANEVLAPE